MFTHIDYINRGINMPYYLALEAGYITLEEYNDLKKMQSNKTGRQHTEFIEYSQSELDDMYKDAFDGNEDAYWNID